MQQPTNRRLRAKLAIALLFASAEGSHAQNLPRQLTMVVPFAAGGPSDVAGRIIAQGLSEVLGQSVVVENPAGAGGTVGSLRVSKSAPNGSQFVIGNSGTHAWSQSLYKHPPYNTLTDFTMLGLVVEAPRAIITPKTFPANAVPEFIAYLKANQATVKYGHAGAGSASHVSCILLNAAMQVEIVAVPYRGLGPALQDLIPWAHRLHVRRSFHFKAAGRRQFRQGDLHHRQAALTGAAAGPDGARAGPCLRRHRLAGPVSSQGYTGADRADAQCGAFQDLGPAAGARALRSAGCGDRGVRAPQPGILCQIRRRGNRALVGSDQGERRIGGLIRPATGHTHSAISLSPI